MDFFGNVMVFQYSQSWAIKLCYKHYTKGENKDSFPSYITSLVSIHHRNIQVLATEFYKIKNGISPELFTEIFARETESQYSLRRCNDFRIPSIRTVYHGSESISFLGPKIWNILHDEIKQPTSLNSFKKSVKKWKPQECPCRLFKVYVNGVGFLS